MSRRATAVFRDFVFITFWGMGRKVKFFPAGFTILSAVLGIFKKMLI